MKKKVEPTKTPFYATSWFIIVMLVICAPVGIYLAYTYSDWQKNAKLIISIFCFAFFLLVCKFSLYAISGSANEKERVAQIQTEEVNQRTSSSSSKKTKTSSSSKKSAASSSAQNVEQADNQSQASGVSSNNDSNTDTTSNLANNASINEKSRSKVRTLYNQLNDQYILQKGAYDAAAWTAFTKTWNNKLQSAKTGVPSTDSVSGAMILDLFNIYQIINRELTGQPATDDATQWGQLDKALLDYFG